MAELKIKADSGGGTVSFKGPATTTSNAAVQLTLPVDDGTANQYLKTDGSGALSWATVTDTDTNTIGLTGADQWRLTTSFTGDAGPIISNWERNDTDAFGKIGTGVSVDGSNGDWTFPDTGYWYVGFSGLFLNNGASSETKSVIYISTDSGSSWTVGTMSSTAIGGESQNWYVSNFAQTIMDVTDVSVQRVRLSIETQNNNVQTRGHSSENYTNVIFLKLGNT